VRKLFAMGCVCFAMVIGFGSIAGCPKGTPKVTPKTSNEAVTSGTSGKGGPVVDEEKAKVKVTVGDVEIAKDGGKAKDELKIKFSAKRGADLKDEAVEVTFTLPKELKGVSVKDSKDAKLVLTLEKGKDDGVLIITVDDPAKTEAFDIGWTAKAGKTATDSGTAKVTKAK
jgi:hypothetical protein